jgi:hypothetical protein
MAAEIAAVADLPLIHHFGVGGVGSGIMNVAWGAGGLIGALIAARVAASITSGTAPAASSCRSRVAMHQRWRQPYLVAGIRL